MANLRAKSLNEKFLAEISNRFINYNDKPTVDTFIKFFEKDFANIKHQYSWDNSGAQVYLGNTPVKRVCVALDLTPSVIEQAITSGCDLLITHHPLLFSSKKSINSKNNTDKLIIKAIQNKINILSYHTNLDVAEISTSRYMAELLEMKNLKLLETAGSEKYVKLAVYTPETHASVVLDALFAVGAGSIGSYAECSFSQNGTGTFYPKEGSSPYIGKTGIRESVKEVKQEVVLRASNLAKVIDSLKKNHPYEMPAFDIYEIQSFEDYGVGFAGELTEAVSGEKFIKILKETFNIKTVRTNGKLPDKVNKIAVGAGSCASMWRDCVGVDIFVTGDMKHHDAIDAGITGVVIADVGHYYSEHIYMGFISELIKKVFSVEVIEADEEPSLIDY